MKSKIFKQFIGISFVLWCILFGLTTKGQTISFTATAPKVLRAGERFQLVYTLDHEVDNFTPPEFGAFLFLGGPMTGSSTSVQMINGKITQNSSYTFTYYLQAPDAGKYTLTSATATYKKNTVKSNALDIEVVGSSQNTGTGSAAQNQSKPQSSSDPSVTGDEEIFIRLIADKKTAFIGEQITVWVKLYTKVDIAAIDEQFKGPDFVGFYKQDIELPPLTSLEREKVGNDIYHTGVLRKMILTPQKNGRIIIKPFEVAVDIQKLVQRRTSIFSSPYQRVRLNLKSKPVEFNIKKLSEPEPSDFTGAVGNFSIDALLSSTQVKTNDAVTLKVTLSGQGNLKIIEELATDFPPTFDTFEPIIKDQTDGYGGKKTFEYTLIPRHPGTFKIAPISISYFNPAKGKFYSISTQGFEIVVEKGAGDSTTVAIGNLSKEDVQLLGSDIRYIAASSKFYRKGNFLISSMGFIGLYFIVSVIFIIILYLRKEQIARSADLVRLRNRKAAGIAHKRLKKAKKLLKSNMTEAFYEELGKALWGYLANKLMLPVSELSRDRAANEFHVRHLDKELIDQFLSLSDECEFARFAPGVKESRMKELFEESVTMLNKLDQNIKK